MRMEKTQKISANHNIVTGKGKTLCCQIEPHQDSKKAFMWSAIDSVRFLLLRFEILNDLHFDFYVSKHFYAIISSKFDFESNILVENRRRTSRRMSCLLSGLEKRMTPRSSR